MCGTTRPTNPTSPAAATVAGREERRDEKHASNRGIHLEPQTRRGFFAECEHIDLATERDERTAPDQEVAEQHGNLRPGGLAHRTHHPPERVTDRIRLGIGEHHHDGRVGERADDDARHQQHPRIAARAGGVRHDERGEHRDDGSDKRRERQQRAGDAGRLRQDGSYRRATRHAEQIRLGERIPHRPLEGRPGHAEPHADE
jgi:hypothetical protein